MEIKEILFSVCVLYFAIVFFVIGCTTNDSDTNQDTRIKVIESTYVNGYMYSIIKIDSTEFITSVKGGIYPL